MASRQIHCSRCGAANEIQIEQCSVCKQPLHDSVQFSNRTRQRPPVKKWSRRAALILGGAILLPIGGTAAYFIQQRLNDPHLLTWQFNGAVLAAAWSPDETRVAAVGWVALPTKWGAQALKVFNPSTGDTLLTGDTDSEVVSGLAPLDVVWSADGQQLVMFIGHVKGMIVENGSRAVEKVQVWDAKTGRRVRSFPVTQPIISQDSGGNLDVQWALCNQYLAVEKRKVMNPNGQDGYYSVLEIWDIATGNSIFAQDMRGADLSKQRRIWAMQWAPDYRRIAALTVDVELNRRVDIWDIQTRKKTQTFSVGTPSSDKLMWSPDGRSLAVGLDIYAVETGSRITIYQAVSQQDLEFMAWSPDEKYVLVRSVAYSRGGLWTPMTTYSLIVLNASNGQQLHTYESGGGSMIWSPRGDYFLAVSENTGTLDVWKSFFWQ